MSGNNDGLIGKDRIDEILKNALSYSQADQTQVTVSVGHNSLTRFAGSVIHQNVAELNAQVEVRAVIGKKIGYVTSNSIEDGEVKRTVEKAVEFARHQQENPLFVSLPSPKPIPEAPRRFFEETAQSTPEDRAGAVEQIAQISARRGGEVAGSFSVSTRESGIASSLGINAFNTATKSNLTMVVTAGNGFGYSHRISSNVGDIDVEMAAEEAAKIAADSRDPISVDPGEYDVILMPYCIGDMLGYLNWLGFNALSYQEGRSFMVGKLGEKICGDNITIWDDGFNPRGMPDPFDGEGLPKQRVELVTNGIAKGLVYDSFTANREGKESTGHSVGGTGTHGPYAWNMFLAPGDATIEDMIKSTKRGLFVTRFHYTNIIHPLLTVITGMTRDGTFLIENGKLTKPVKNLRFTQSVLEALSNVEMVGKDLVRQGRATVPALKIKDFRFTGATEF